MSTKPMSMNVHILVRSSKRLLNDCIITLNKSKQSVVNVCMPVTENLKNISQNNFSSNSNGSKNNYKPVLSLLTKENCSLCTEAKDVLFAAPCFYKERLVLQEVDILAEGNEELFNLYRYEIPVFFLGRKFISKNKIDLSKLEQELKNLEENLNPNQNE